MFVLNKINTTLTFHINVHEIHFSFISSFSKKKMQTYEFIIKMYVIKLFEEAAQIIVYCTHFINEIVFALCIYNAYNLYKY